MKTRTLPRKAPLTRGNGVEVAEVAAVAPGARRGEVREPLLTRPRGTYLQQQAEVQRVTQRAYPLRYLRYPRYPGDETPGQAAFSPVAVRAESAATQPLPQREKESS